MGKDSDWTSKYLGSDHHTDRYIGTVVRYEDKTGLRHEEPYRVIAERVKNRGRIMNYYQSVDYEPVAPIRRRRYSDMEDDDLYTTAGIFPAARKALSISNKAMDDGDIRTSVSTRKDQQLLSDITAKLYNIELEQVRPSYDVALRTGGYRRTKRRGKRSPGGEQQGRTEERLDELRYPRNYAAVLACNDEDNDDFNPQRWQVPERCAKLYKPRPENDDFFTAAVTSKRRVPSEKDNAKIELIELMARSRSAFAPLHEDQDEYVVQPMPTPIPSYRPYVSRYAHLGSTTEYNLSEQNSNPRVAQKIAESNRDIEEFDAMLDDRFRKSSAPSRSRYDDFRSAVTSSPAEILPAAVDEQAQADIAQPVVVRAPSRRVAVRQTAPRIVVGRGSTIYPYTSLPDEVVYSRRSMRAASVPPSPVLSAAEIEYVPGFSRRMEMYTRAESEPPEQIRQKVGYYYGRQPASVEYPGDVAVMSYAPSYYSSGRSAYAVPASPASRRVRYSYSETSPDVSPAYTLNNLRVRTSDARNKLDAHRTMLDRYLPDTGIEEDVQSAVLYKYGELVDRAKSLGRKCQTLGKDYERSYAARKEIPSIMPTNAYYGYYCY